MKFTELFLKGAYLIEMEPHIDERGHFARTFCAKEFADHGLVTNFVQCSTSFNKEKGTMRGMHYQEEPYAETKIVRCARGSIYDVMIDIRPDSPTYNQWYGEELTADNGKMLYIPKGFSHGFQTLVNDSEVFYQIDNYYVPESARVMGYDDNHIKWPIRATIISPRDQLLC